MAKCKCKTSPRIISSVVQSMNNHGECCRDVCANPICEDPTTLGLFAPLIYDEIGINLCTTFELGTDISAEYPTAVSARIKVIGAAYTYGDGNVVIESLSGRPNCYRVTLSNITVQFALSLYDSACRLIATIFPTAVYLPPTAAAPTYDEDTNPTSIELDLYAPYGLSYNTVGTTPAPVIHFIGFGSGTDSIRQGINLYGIAKLLDFSTEDDTVTVGLTLVLQSLYYAGYKVATSGKIEVPKGSILTPEDSSCMRFVAGDLLNLAIKPLDLGEPFHEEQNKNKCCCKSGCSRSCSCESGGCCNHSGSGCGFCGGCADCSDCQGVSASDDTIVLAESPTP